MAAPNLHEVFNFVNKFMNLRKNGENATLSLQCHDGSVSVNLHLHLPSYPSPRYERHQPPQPRPGSRPSPSRVRRSTRRANARANAEKSDKEQAHAQQTPAEQAATDEKSLNQGDDAEEAIKNDITRSNLTDDVEVNKAEEAFDKKGDEITQLQHSEANAAEKASLDEKVTESIQNKSEANSANLQLKNLLLCHYCDQGFANEDLLREHTEIDHRSRRIRYRRI